MKSLKLLKLIVVLGGMSTLVAAAEGRSRQSFVIRSYESSVDKRQVNWSLKLYPNRILTWSGKNPLPRQETCFNRTGEFQRQLSELEFQTLMRYAKAAFTEQLAEKKGRAIPLKELKLQTYDRPTANLILEEGSEWKRVEVFNPAMPEWRSLLKQVEVWKRALANTQSEALKSVAMGVEQRKSIFKITFSAEGKDDVYLKFPLHAKDAFQVVGSEAKKIHYLKRPPGNAPIPVTKEQPYTLWVEAEGAPPNSQLLFESEREEERDVMGVALCGQGETS